MKLSPSSLSLLSECPRCFWLSFNGVKRPESIFPSLPAGMDKILKEHFDRYATLGKLPPSVSISGAKPFNDLELLNIWRSNFKGISYSSGSDTLRGAVDNILVLDGKLLVLDFKTRGFPLKEDTALHYTDQMNIYNYLLRKNGYKTCSYSYLLFYHPSTVDSNGLVVFNTDLVKVPVNVASAERLWKKALKVLSGRMPKASPKCEWCKYREEKKS
jgi:hypothetical protein